MGLKTDLLGLIDRRVISLTGLLVQGRLRSTRIRPFSVEEIELTISLQKGQKSHTTLLELSANNPRRVHAFLYLRGITNILQGLFATLYLAHVLPRCARLSRGDSH